MSAGPAARTENALSFVVFSDDWGEHPSSCQHLFRRVARAHPVLWVNTIGLRNPKPTWSDLKKAKRKLLGMLERPRAARGGRETGLDLTVCRPVMLPFSAWPGVRAFNRRSVVKAVGAAVTRGPDVVVSTVPNACDVVDRLGARAVIYYCVDDFSRWPGHDRELVRSMERELIAKADMILAASPELAVGLGATGKPTHVFPHAVDLDLFGQPQRAEHASLAGIPRPRIGYFGLIDERSDQELIAALAERMPDHSFVLAGPVATAVQRLAALRNVHFTGAIPYAQLPALAHGLDVLFLPYGLNELTRTLSPLKLLEYLATGKPVVSTDLADARRWQPWVAVAATAGEWEAALRAGMAADVEARLLALAPLLAPESWQSRARTFLDLAGAAANAPQLRRAG